mgnify:FL=1
MLWRKTLTYWRSLAIVCTIAYVCLLREPHVTLPPVTDIDKWAHGVMYLVLALVMLWDNKKVGILASYSWMIVVLFSAIFGGFIEILQEYFFYPRTGDWMDWLADCTGTWVGTGIWYIGQKWYERRMAQ